MAAPIAIVFNAILLIILLILAVICVKMWVRIFSLKKQHRLHRFSLEKITEKEEGPKQDLVKIESSIDQPKNL